ncbi:hypothetical protein [Priestia megaterium]|uniref:hypothetical protein n=1 Tax=Priestia megaterium TaxID=1404 RepID=UPI00300850E9
MKFGTLSILITKISLILILYLYYSYVDISIQSSKIEAGCVLLLSLIFLFQTKSNLILCLVAFFIFYCNYSIVLGEYLIGGNLGIPVYEVKTTYIYGLTLRTLLLFVLVINLFYKKKDIKITNLEIKLKDNFVLFYGGTIILLYILIFGINRTELSTYSVSITPMYEYSILIFVLSYYYSGGIYIRKVVLSLLMFLFVLQDFYYGGRITSLQLILLFLVTIFVNKLSFKKILMFGLVGIILNSLVGAYRNSFELDRLNLLSVLSDLKDNMFVFDTPVYAYYASATHIAASEIIDSDTKLRSFFAFLGSVFLGDDSEIGNLTLFISNNYFLNIGGGVIPSHFYFWFGWIGVLAIAIIIVIIMNKFAKLEKDYHKLTFLIFIVTVPRWYLYSPLNLIKPILFLLIMFFVYKVFHIIIYRSVKKRIYMYDMKDN